ncbi:hypothetical protein [Mesorhizobium sp. 8]|uniref:hypothetical protein n=1 Tax=Mesorhizobium sp. 8 TaxID=2584466 RepID=UPI00112093E9|nr:hypothetical protein [Mesorhizobium sp. 8]QDC01720.1 hypothetical protein FGU64_15525 [Mesorhizobium sp. 8]
MPFFNNPAFGRAYDTIAAMLAPPSGAEAAGWATASARQADTNRRGQVFDYATDPNFDQERFDRMGTGAGLWTPSQGYYAVDKDDATKRYGFDTQAATLRANNAADNARALAMNRLDNQRSAITDLFKPLDPGQVRPEVTPEFMDALHLPAAPAVAGAPKPLSETEWRASQNQRLLDGGQLTDQDLLDAITGDKTPVKAIDPNTHQPAFMSPGAAVRQGAQPYEAASAERVDNYLALGPNGEEVRFPGIVGPDGRIVDANTGRVVPNVVRKEGTGGGMSFEADGQGGVRFTTGGAGNTVSQQTNLQGQRDAATQSARELQTLFDNIAASDVGVAGNFNDFLTNYGAQVFPNVARGDVTAMRTQMQTTAMRMARSLAGDNRISDTDRRMAEDIMVGQGLGESLPGAKAKLATLVVLNAYRAKFAGSLASGGAALPPINGSVLGQLVDDGAITPALADEYQRTMLSSKRGGPTRIPSVGELERDFNPTQLAAPQKSAPAAAPAGVDPADWEFLTPEEKALFR